MQYSPRVLGGRITVSALAGLAVTALCACGPGGSGYGCTGSTCTAMFDGSGSLDMSDQLGRGATVKVSDIRSGAVTVRVDGARATAVRGQPVEVGRLRITLRGVKGKSVMLRVVGSGLAGRGG